MESRAAGLCSFLGAGSLGSHPLGGAWLAVGSTAAPVRGCVPRRATGTHLQMAVLKAWVGEDGGFPPVLGFWFFFIIKI